MSKRLDPAEKARRLADRQARRSTARVCASCGGKKAWRAKSCAPCMGHQKHGLSYDPVYRAWQTMRQRCIVATNPSYEDYGGRGITVCAAWVNSAATFVADMGPKPTPRHELDRKENNDGYWCGKCEECVRLGRVLNCRWVTRSQNDRNRRSTRWLTLNGDSRPVIEWCERLGIPEGTLRARLDLGLSDEDALTRPIRRRAAKERAA